MLRYRVAYDPDRGHFVLPVLSALFPLHQTFASRAAAQKTALARNSKDRQETRNESSPAPPDFLQTFLRRASA